jgi:hypothetical protein
MQQLLARQLEVQAHLPPTTEDGESDDDDDEDDDEDYEIDDDDCITSYRSASSEGLGGGSGQGRHRCPYPKCSRNTPFKSRRALTVHHQKRMFPLNPVTLKRPLMMTIDIRCHEICVFCRETFTRVRKYVRHNCKSKRRQRDKTKEYYRKERCSQLRNHAIQKLDAMLARQETPSNGRRNTGKRSFPDSGGLRQDSTSKRHTATVYSTANMSFHNSGEPLGDIALFPTCPYLLTRDSHVRRQRGATAIYLQAGGQCSSAI